MNINLFSYEDLSAVVKKLLEIDQRLDKLLSEYQPSDRRAQIEQMKELSEPINLLLPLSACLNEDSGVIEVDQDLRSVELDDEFLKSKPGIGKLIRGLANQTATHMLTSHIPG